MVKVKGGGVVITPKRFVAQWQNTRHIFQVNLWNFEVEAGKAVRSVFRKSFDLKRFNSSGESAWAPRSKNYRRTHPLMFETGTLKHSITWKNVRDNDGSRAVLIYTDPNGFMTAKRHKGFCYAAVHNGPQRFRTGKVQNMPRRQFMGYSSEAKKELTELKKTIFRRFPR